MFLMKTLFEPVAILPFFFLEQATDKFPEAQATIRQAGSSQASQKARTKPQVKVTKAAPPANMVIPNAAPVRNPVKASV